jgi:hypothetical protein
VLSAGGSVAKHRTRIYPIGVTAGEWRYLQRRFPDPVVAQQARERITDALQRLVRRGFSAKQLHEALMRGTYEWEQHEDARAVKRMIERHRELVEQAENAVALAVASLRRLLPLDAPDPLDKTGRRRVPTPFARWDDDTVFDNRGEILKAAAAPKPAKRGRPWHWKQETETALRQLGVPPVERRELIGALGFIDE